jgi:hypothetical protein
MLNPRVVFALANIMGLRQQVQHLHAVVALLHLLLLLRLLLTPFSTFLEGFLAVKNHSGICSGQNRVAVDLFLMENFMGGADLGTCNTCSIFFMWQILSFFILCLALFLQISTVFFPFLSFCCRILVGICREAIRAHSG